MTELDLTQRCPPFRDEATHTMYKRLRVALHDGEGAAATIADLLSCLAALPVETQVAT